MKFEAVGTTDVEELEESDETPERDPLLVSLWKKYHFMGEPPVKGSPVEERLYNTCERYMRIVLNQDFVVPLKKDPSGYEGGENYFVKKTEPTSSDASRRELHNQIALMVAGTQRSGMAYARAEEIANFACELVNGYTLDKAMAK